jgi:hypothetical protein
MQLLAPWPRLHGYLGMFVALPTALEREFLGFVAGVHVLHLWQSLLTSVLYVGMYSQLIALSLCNVGYGRYILGSWYTEHKKKMYSLTETLGRRRRWIRRNSILESLEYCTHSTRIVSTSLASNGCSSSTNSQRLPGWSSCVTCHRKSVDNTHSTTIPIAQFSCNSWRRI